MRGRWAMFAAGRAVSNSRTNAAMQQQQQQADYAMQQQQQLAQQQAQAQQAEIDRLRAQQSQNNQNTQSSNSGQEDITVKLQKLGQLHQQGVLTDEEFSKMKMQLLTQM
jgi:putative oligomerization/nucleic acid binding protein